MNNRRPATRHNYVLIFRWWFRHHRTGKIIRSRTGRPFPLWVRVRH